VLPSNQPTHVPDEQLKQLQLAYQMATEMSQFKGGYLARISHEVRSPLNGLIGMHQLILSDLCDSPEEEREFIAQANTSARKMVDVLDRILDVARVQQGTARLDIQPVQLAEIFQDLHSLTHLQAQDRNIGLKLLPPDSDIYVQVDLPRFRQVLIHLIDAALLKQPEDGVTVSANLSTSSNTVHIWIDDRCPASARSEPVDLLQTEIPKEATLPSSGLNLLADQMILQMMKGQLEVVPVNSRSDAAVGSESSLTQIQCSVPGYRAT
jgi:signal transduction histidine kinase